MSINQMSAILAMIHLRIRLQTHAVKRRIQFL